MARRDSEGIGPEGERRYVPNLEDRLPELIAERTGGDPEDYDYPDGEYRVPDLEDQQLEPVE